MQNFKYGNVFHKFYFMYRSLIVLPPDVGPPINWKVEHPVLDKGLINTI
jgi:hypothetical protein